ncbi:MAG: PAS domain S-box protein, partial [Myxococcaceae bacterium]|nr:PAS domain S-box protein [Myxococcaceae bacterium]
MSPGRIWSLEALRELLETFQVPMAASHETRVWVVNEAYCAMLGHPREAIEGSLWETYSAPEEIRRLHQRYELRNRGEIATGHAYPILVLGRGGRRIHCLLQVSYLPREGGGEWAVGT